ALQFVRPNVAIVWHPSTGAYQLAGRIFDTWLTFGPHTVGPRIGDLGYPTSDEGPTADGTGRRQSFQPGAMFYDTRRQRAFGLYGGVYNGWQGVGGERGALGRPTSSAEVDFDGVLFHCDFSNHATLYFDARNGVYDAVFGKDFTRGSPPSPPSPHT